MGSYKGQGTQGCPLGGGMFSGLVSGRLGGKGGGWLPWRGGWQRPTEFLSAPRKTRLVGQPGKGHRGCLRDRDAHGTRDEPLSHRGKPVRFGCPRCPN